MGDFRLKHFAIQQAHTAMKLGTDALLLGGWVARLGLPLPERILDVGAGTGILTLMCAQTFPSAHLTALEIDAGAVSDARANASASPFGERITILHTDARAFRIGEQSPYDLIISNPPYFEASALASPERGRSLARREATDGLNWRTLLELARPLLSREGSLVFIAPIEREQDLRTLSAECLYRIERVCYARSYASGEPIRLMLQLRHLDGSDHFVPCLTDHLSIRNDQGDYSDEYRSLLSDFLLP